MKTVSPKAYVLVTGTSRGLGKALVEALCESGLTVAAVSRHPGPFSGQTEGRSQVRMFAVDITDTPKVDRELGRLFGDWGVPAIVVHNAGVLRYRGVQWKEPDESVRETLDANVMAPVLWVARMVPGMIKAGLGGARVPVVDRRTGISNRMGFLRFVEMGDRSLVRQSLP